MDAFYAAVVQSVEEAVLNALVVNDDMVGRDGHRSPRLPIDRLTHAARMNRTAVRNKFGLQSVYTGEAPGGPAPEAKETQT